MIPDAYVWLVWSSAFLVPWLALYAAYRRHRRAMLWASLFTAPFGLSEPLFVPEYWSPPSLFDLARTTGFDLESLIFCFGIGGIGAVLVNVLTRRRPAPLAPAERHARRHRFHRWALASPFVVFPLLWLLPWNPIYPGIAAMLAGAAATVACRPDLARNTALGAVIFIAFYLVFLAGLEWTAPGYIERVWNLDALSGWTVLGFPLEELLFAGAFGAYWAVVYEHFNLAPAREGTMSEPRITFLGAAGTLAGGGGGAMRPGVLQAERVLALWGFLLNLAWEAGQTPLYEDADRGVAYLVWTRLHCTAGDVLILLGAFWLTSLVCRSRRWFARPGALAPGLFVVLGLAYTAWSEWANTSLRDAWQYRPQMPTLFGIGLAPLLQWLVIPPILVLLLRRSPQREPHRHDPA